VGGRRQEGQARAEAGGAVVNISTANRGRSLETAIVTSQARTIVLDHHGQEAKRLPGGRMVAKRGPVDFTGTVCANGLSIRFDAKKCDLVHRFPIGNLDHFPAHQRVSLIRHGEAGAIAGLLVEATALGEFRWLGWRAIAAITAPSLPWADERWVVLGPTTHAIRFERIPGVTHGKDVA
jgi:hypothetical protein